MPLLDAINMHLDLTDSGVDDIGRGCNKLNANVPPGDATRAATVLDNFQAQTAGKALSVRTGGTELRAIDWQGKEIVPTGAANAIIGSAVLSSGTVTVSTTAVTANSLIFITTLVAGGTIGEKQVGTITAGTSFVINSVQPGTASTIQASDTSTVAWMIFN